MHLYVELAILGLGASAAYALLASGLVLIYRASGVLNFAQGALAMAGAYLFYELNVVHHWAYVPAVLASVVVIAAVGALIYLLIMRPLRHAAVVVRIIATLAVLTIIQSAATLKYQGNAYFLRSPLPKGALHWGVKFPQDRLWLIGIAGVLTIILHVFATRTTFGLATRGVAENQRTAAAVGWSPDFVATINWAIGAGLAAFAGILIVPISSLSVTSLTWLVVPAFAVALLGAFSSFPLAFLGAVGLGMAQGAVTKVQTDIPGVADALPLLVILLALVLRRQAIPGRGEILQRLPRWVAASSTRVSSPRRSPSE